MKKWILAIGLLFLAATNCFAKCETTIDGHEVCNFSITDWYGLTSAPALSSVGTARVYFDMVGGTLKCSQDGAAYTNCVGSGSGGSGNVQDGTLNIVPHYVGISTVGPSSNIYIVGSNLGIGSITPGATLDVQGNGRFSSTIGASNYSGTSSGINTGDQTCATTSGCVVNAITNVGIGTINTVTYWASTSSIGSLNTSTYPSLTELSYIKGVTSAIQTQLDGKQATGNYITALTGNDVTAAGPGSVAATLNSQWKGWTDGGTNVYTSTTTDNVGIGTTTPNAATLEIVKNAAQPLFKISSVATGSGDYLIVSSTGNAGIGTVNATNTLTVSTASSSSGGIDINNNGAAGASGCDGSAVLLMHMDGANAGTSFTDSECFGTAKTITANGNGQTSTAQKEFGTASYLGDGAGDYLSIPASTDFAFASGGFTIDFWSYPNDVSTGTQPRLFSITDPTGNDDCRIIFGSISNGDVALICDVGGVTKLNFRTSAGAAVSTGSWQHIEIAVDNSGNAGYIFVGGVAKSVTLSQGAYNNALITSSTAAYVGAGKTGGASYNGYIDELRVSKGIIRHTSGFTPNTSAYASIGPSTINYQTSSSQKWTAGSDSVNFKISKNSDLTSPYLTITSGGNFGIGTILPTSTLSVLGNVGIGNGAYTTINGGASNGLVVQGNVGVGTFIPSTSLEISDTTSQPHFRVNDSGIGDTSPALFTDANGNVGVGTSNASLNILNIKGATAMGTYASSSSAPSNGLIVSGSVGVGTIAPGNKLEANGVISSTSGGFSFPDLTVQTTASAGWQDGGTNVYTSTTTDNVGIGTTTPASSTTLEVVKNASGNAPLRISSVATGAGDYFIINSNGNIGIGTIQNSNLFTVSSSDATTYVNNPASNASTASITITNRNTTASNFEQIKFNTYTAAATEKNIAKIIAVSTNKAGGSENGHLIFATMTAGALNERMRLDANGGLGIGTFGGPNSKLVVSGNGSFGSGGAYTAIAAPTDGLKVQGNVGIGTWVPNGALEVINPASGNTFLISSTSTSAGDQLIVQTAGNVGIGTKSPMNTLQVKGTFQIDNANSIGWSGVSAANQACNTTCVSGCVVGFDQGTLGVSLGSIVACTDATADECICAGPS